MNHCRNTRSRRAFTLVELLVVIGIIAVLMGLLLPTLGGARKQARTLQCASNMRQLMYGAAMYWGENRGAIPGPNTSGLRLHRGGTYGGTPDAPVQDWDFISPSVGKTFSNRVGATAADYLQKYQDILMHEMRCPENEFRYFRKFTGPDLPMAAGGGEHPYVTSYMTPVFFGLRAFGTAPAATANTLWEMEQGGQAVRQPIGYVPLITKVGDLSTKVYAFEGARYLDTGFGATALDYSTVTNATGLSATPQGCFTSRGPAFLTSFSSGEPYVRDGNNKPTLIYKLVSLRHRDKMNVAFFDGHVELLGDREASRLELWVPKGTIVAAQSHIAFRTDVNARWNANTTVP